MHLLAESAVVRVRVHVWAGTEDSLLDISFGPHLSGLADERKT